MPRERVTVLDQEINERDYHHDRGSIGGIILIIAGVILLLNTLGVISWDVWDIIFDFWPVVLILWGLQIILGSGKFSKFIMGIFTLIFLILIGLFAVLKSNPELRIYFPTPALNSIDLMEGFKK